MLLEDSAIAPSLAPTTLSPAVAPDTRPRRIRSGVFNANLQNRPSRHYDENGNLRHSDQYEYFDGQRRAIYLIVRTILLPGLIY